MVDGNLSVRLKRAAGDVFVWKKKEVAATAERLKELRRFGRSWWDFWSWVVSSEEVSND